jgi:hypothetical protein
MRPRFSDQEINQGHLREETRTAAVYALIRSEMPSRRHDAT